MPSPRACKSLINIKKKCNTLDGFNGYLTLALKWLLKQHKTDLLTFFLKVGLIEIEKVGR